MTACFTLSSDSWFSFTIQMLPVTSPRLKTILSELSEISRNSMPAFIKERRALWE